MSQPEPLQLDLFGSAELPSWQVPKPVRPPSLPRQQAEPPAPVPPTTSPPKRQVQVSNYCLDYTLRRSKRRSIGFLIDDDGLRITAPKWISVADIEEAIREKQRWILNKLHEVPPPGTLQAIRAVRVLEEIGSPEAQGVLNALSKGAPTAHQTVEATAALFHRTE